MRSLSPSSFGPVSTPTPSILLNATSGPVGSPVSMTGSGFANSSDVTLTFDGNALATNPLSVTTDSSGAFSSVFVAPQTVAGRHTVNAADASGNNASGSFTVVASIKTDQADYAPMTTVAIYGAGFLAASLITVSVTQPNGTVNSWQTTSNSSGNFATTYLLDDLFGTYLVNATDGMNSATTSFTDFIFSVTVACAPNPVAQTTSTTCTITTTNGNGGHNPIGSVIKFQSSGSGAFSPINGQCTISGSNNNGQCSVSYVPSASGTQTITTSCVSGDCGEWPAAGTNGNTFSLTVNPALSAGAVTPSSPTIDSGQSITLTAHPSGGTPSYTYQWYTGSSCTSPISGATSSTYVASMAATYYYKVTDSSSPTHETACSAGDIVNVDSVVTAGAITPSNPSIDAGQSVTLTSHASGGTGTYSYQWYTATSSGTCSTSDTVISGATASTYTVPTSTPSGTYFYCYIITDIGVTSGATPAATSGSPTDTVTVNPVVSVLISPSNPSIDSGQSIILTANPSGGSGIYSTYQWYSNSACTTVIGGAISPTYSASASGTYCVKATDSLGGSGTGTDTVTVNNALVAGAITPANPTIDAGQSITLTSNPSLGTAPYTYQWFNGALCTGSPIPGATSATYSASTAGTYYYQVTDSSAAGHVSQCSAGDIVTANSALVAGAVTPSSPAIDSGQTVTLTANPSGGTTPYSYQWYTGATCTTVVSGQTSSTLSTSPGATTTYSYRVTDASQGSPAASACSAGDTVTVNPVLSAGAITPSSPAIDNGQTLTLTAHPSGGTSPYGYQWYSATSCTNPISGATSSIFSASPASTTTYSYKVTDSSQGTPAASTCSAGDTVTVNNVLVANAITPSSPSIDSGQSMTLTSNPSGGTSPYTYQWFSAAGCSSGAISGATSSIYSATASGTYYYQVTDSSAAIHVSQCSAGDTVTVNPVLTVGSPATYTIDIGQSITLTASSSGGTAPFSYQWYQGANCNNPISGQTSQTFIASPTSAQAYSYKVTDSSAAGAKSVCITDGGLQVNVNNDLSITSLATPITIDSGQSFQYSTTASSGTAPYTYSWSLPVGLTSTLGCTSTSSTCTVTSTSPGSYTISVTVTDSSQGTGSGGSVSSSSTLTVKSQFTGTSVTISPSATIDSGESILLTVTWTSSGASPYSVQLETSSSSSCTSHSPTGSPKTGLTATSTTFSVSPSTTTIYCAQVADGAHSPESSSTASGATITVNPALSAPTILAASPIYVGQTTTVTVSWSGGTSSYTITLFSSTSSSSCTGLIQVDQKIGVSASTYQFTESPTSSTNYCASVTDSAASPVTMTTATPAIVIVILIRSTSASVSCSPSSIAVNDVTVCTGQVTDTAPGTKTTPSGTIAFSDSSGVFSSENCSGSGATLTCTVSFTPSPGSEGTQSLGASYPGDSTHSSSVATPFSLSVTVRTASTSIMCSATAVNQATTCTVTVSDVNSGTPTVPAGTVDTFTDNGAGGSFGSTSCNLSSGECTFSYTPAPGTAGTTITISVKYEGDTDHSTSTGSGSLTPTKRSTSTAIICSPTTLPISSETSCTVTVTDTNTGTYVTPTGTVTLSDSPSGSGSFGTCTLGGSGPSESCVVSYTPSPGKEGPITLKASFNGDSAHFTSFGTQAITATVRTTSTSISCVPLTLPVNSGTICTVTVTDTSPGTAIVPSGTVSFGSSSTGTFSPGASCTLNGSGKCSVAYAPSLGTAGSHGITATYNADTDHSGSSSSTTLTVTKRTTSTLLSCSSPVPVNAPTTCSATVSDTDTGTAVTPSGTITFSTDSAGTFSSSSCTLIAGVCSITYTPGLGSEGLHNIGASYGGDADHSISGASFALSVTKRTTSTTVSCLPSSIAVNDATTCTAIVMDNDAGTATTPTGSVLFISSGSGSFSSFGSCVLSQGVYPVGTASCSVTYTPTLGSEGTHNIGASYSADKDHFASVASSDFEITATKRTTVTSLSCHPQSLAVNDVTTCTVTVTDTNHGTPSTPTGSVYFNSDNSGSFSSSSCVLSEVSPGLATCSVGYTPALGSEGTHDIGASYNDDTDHLGSSASDFGLTVTTRTTSTTVTCSPSSVAVNDETFCTATVTDTNHGTLSTPIGTVTFSADNAGSFSSITCNLTPVSTGVASCSVGYSPSLDHEGTHNIGANYGGDTDHSISSAQKPFALTATKRSTLTRVSCSAASMAVDAPTQCTATVTDVSTGTGVAPSGMVSFTDSTGNGYFDYSSCTLTAVTGHVYSVCSVNFSPKLGSEGTHTITASYGGDVDHFTSSSSGVSDFVITAIARSTSVSISCPADDPVDSAVQCTVTVTDVSSIASSFGDNVPIDLAPLGTVAFSDSGGYFDYSTCSLAGSSSFDGSGNPYSTCSVHYAPKLQTEGSHTIGATYLPVDVNHLGSAGSTSITATIRSTIMIVSCSSLYGFAVDAPANCTATVTDTSAVASFGDTNPLHLAPSGTVTFTDPLAYFDSTNPCMLSPVSGEPQSTCSVDYSPALGSEGVHSIAATHGGDTDHIMNSAGSSIAAVQRSVSVSVWCTSSYSFAVDTPASCMVTVTDVSPIASWGDNTLADLAPSGTVTLSDSGAYLSPMSGECTLSPVSLELYSQCSVSYSPKLGTEGTHTVSASYSPSDVNHNANSASTTLTATTRITSTSIVCSSWYSFAVDTPGTCAVTVSDTSPIATFGDTNPADLAPTGTVNVMDLNAYFDSTNPCTLAPIGGVARSTCTVDYSPKLGTVGSHSVSSTYNADVDHSTSSGTVTVSVTARTTMTVVSCPSTDAVDSPVTCVVTVTDTSPVGFGDSLPTDLAPVGTVTFADAQGYLNPASCQVLASSVFNIAGQAYSTCSVQYAPKLGTEGTHSISASYSPTSPSDVNHYGGSGITSITAVPRATSTSVSCASSSIPVNAPDQCTVVITDTSPIASFGDTNPSDLAPTGTVTLSDSPSGSGTFGSCVLAPSGASESCDVNYTPSPGKEGPIILEISFNGDVDHSISSSTRGITATVRTSSTSILCTPSTLPVNSATTCTVTVKDTDIGTKITPTGTIAFTDSPGSSGTFTGTCTLSGSAGTAICSVTYTPSLGKEGPITVMASFLGDTDHAVSSAGVQITATVRATSTSVTCTTSSVAVYAQTICTATVTDTDTGTAVTPSGTVTFSSGSPGSFNSMTCTLTGGSCSVTYTPALGSEGTHTIGASYGGDQDHATSANSFSLTVTRRNTSTSVLCSAGSVAVDAPILCTATVTDTSSGTGVAPSGTVTFSDPRGFFDYYGCTLAPVSGQIYSTCSVNFSPNPGSEGTHTVSATYSDDADHFGSGPSGFDVTASKRSTAITVNCSVSTLSVDSPTVCTGYVTDISPYASFGVPSPYTSLAPTGTISFSSSDVGDYFSMSFCSLLASSAVLVAGQVQTSCSMQFAPALGSESVSHVIAAAYSDDGDHFASGPSSPFSITAIQRLTVTTISCAYSSVAVDAPDQCTVTAVDTSPLPSGFGDSTPADLAPSGSVTLSAMAGDYFTACSLAKSSTLNLAGQPFSTCTVNFAPALGGEGVHTITASYGTDTDHSTSSGQTAVTATQRLVVVSILCSPTQTTSFVVDTAAMCTVTVADNSPVASFGDQSAADLAPMGSVTLSDSMAAYYDSMLGGNPNPCTLSAVPGIAESQCTIDYSPALGSEGTHLISATYNGDTDHHTNSAGTSAIAVQRSVSASLSCTSSYNFAVDTPASCTVTVTDVSPLTLWGDQNPADLAPIGTVTVGDSSGYLSPVSGQCVLSQVSSQLYSKCSVSYSPKLGTEGSHTVGASYSPTGPTDLNHNGNSAITSISASARMTSTAVVCSSPYNFAVDAPAACTATTTDNSPVASFGDTSPLDLAPTGTVSMGDSSAYFDSTNPCFLSPVSGVARSTCTVDYSPKLGALGSHSVSATYNTDKDHFTSSGSVMISAIARSTSASVSCPASDSVDSPITCTVTVTDTSPIGFGDGTAADLAPIGTVTLTDANGYFSSATCQLVASSIFNMAGQAYSACSVQYAPKLGTEGSHSIGSTYSPTSSSDVNHFGSSTSTTVTAVVRATSTSVSCTLVSVPVDAPDLCTATIADSSQIASFGDTTPLHIAPGGTVTFSSSISGDYFSSLTCSLVGSSTLGAGQAYSTCSVSFSPKLGSEAQLHSVSASYSTGDLNHATSGPSSFSVTATIRTTSTTVNCSPGTLVLNGQSTCTATVTDNSPVASFGVSVPTPSGTISFVATGGSFVQTTCTLSQGSNPVGTSSCFVTYTASSAGTQSITGSYGGDADHSTSSGSGTVIVWNLADNSCIADGNYNCNDQMEAVFTQCSGGSCQLTATNPGEEFYVLQFTNNQATAISNLMVSIVIPYDPVFSSYYGSTYCSFLLKGANPVMLNGNPVSFSQSGCSSSGNTITVNVGTVGTGQTITITMHMDYALKYGYTGKACTSGSPTRCSSTAFNHGYTFHTFITFSGQSTPLPMTDANVGIVGKLVTAIGGFLTDTNGNPKSNLEVVTYSGKGACPSVPPTNYAGEIIVYSDMSGWYFVTLPSSGWYTSCIYNSVGQLKHSASVSLGTNQFVELDVNKLQPSDPIIMGEVVTGSGVPLSGVTVELIGVNGKILASTTTDGAGDYVFRFSQPGTYSVVVIPPAGYSCLSSCSVTVSLSQFQTAYVNYTFVAKTTQ